jgi:hypothetical protein
MNTCRDHSRRSLILDGQYALDDRVLLSTVVRPEATVPPVHDGTLPGVNRPMAHANQVKARSMTRVVKQSARAPAVAGVPPTSNRWSWFAKTRPGMPSWKSLPSAGVFVPRFLNED